MEKHCGFEGSFLIMDQTLEREASPAAPNEGLWSLVKGRVENIKMEEELNSMCLCLLFQGIQHGTMKKVPETCSCPRVHRGKCEYKIGGLR